MVSPESPLARPPAENLQHSQVKTKFAHRAKLKGSTWLMGSWNVRSLPDCEGPVETAKQGTESEQSDIRRIDQVVKELERYRICAAALQETKWFGDAIYRVGDSTVVAAGRPTPAANEPRQRGEGVAIVLRGAALQAWEAGGGIWKAWSSRLVTVTLQPGKSQNDRIHILSCYAPTFSASRVDKNKFLDDLQHALDVIPPSECYVLMGDFNARVGSRIGEDDQWRYVRGPHGLGEVNDAGKELLLITFLSINEATISNTWFPKKEIYKGTWQHPKSKRRLCIDFAVVRQRDSRKCLDACVKCGAECNTDHQLLRIKMTVKGARGYSRPRSKSHKSFAVTRLIGRDDSCNNNTRDTYRASVCSKAVEEWSEDGTLEEKWSAVRSSSRGDSEGGFRPQETSPN